MSSSAILIIAGQEMRTNVRNRWTILFAAVFGVLALAIAYFGLVVEGYAGVQGFQRTTASMLSLVLYLVPLIALIMCAVSLTGDRGAAELLFSQPLPREHVLIGKILGVFGSIAMAMLLGFGAAGAVIAIQAGTDGLLRFASFVLIALLLALAIVSIAALVSVFGQTRARALGLSVLAWFLLVLFYDLLILGAGLLLKERAANTLVFLSLFGNPVDAARVGALLSMGGAATFGQAGQALVKFLGGPALAEAALVLTMLAWTAGPLVLACRKLRRQDI